MGAYRVEQVEMLIQPWAGAIWGPETLPIRMAEPKGPPEVGLLACHGSEL